MVECVRGHGSRIPGRGALLLTLRALLRRVERFALHRATSRGEQLWAGRLADRLEAALTEALDSLAARASLEAVERRRAISRKTRPTAAAKGRRKDEAPMTII
jgi:hypothetical protein